MAMFNSKLLVINRGFYLLHVTLKFLRLHPEFIQVLWWFRILSFAGIALEILHQWPFSMENHYVIYVQWEKSTISTGPCSVAMLVITRR